MKKIIASVLCAAMVLSLAACGSKPATTTTAAPTTTTAAATTKAYTVGICQLIEHPALDLATKGFKEALTEKLGASVTFLEATGGGELSNCTTIVAGYTSKNVDLIMANATAALQAAAAATDKIPVLGTSITEYGVALDLKDFNGTIGNNVSGTSDLAPLDEQAAMIKEWMPDVKKVALVYCSGEANSLYQVKAVAAELNKMGVETKEFSFTDSNDVTQVTEKACSYGDALYIPTDNTAASNTEAIANVCIPAGKAAFVGEEGICKGCGVATLSISYYDLGYATGLMAAKILTGEADVSKMPIEYAAKVTKMYNEANVKALGLTVPAGYEAIKAE